MSCRAVLDGRKRFLAKSCLSEKESPMQLQLSEDCPRFVPDCSKWKSDKDVQPTVFKKEKEPFQPEMAHLKESLC